MVLGQRERSDASLLLDRTEAAAMLGVSTQTLDRHAKSGHIKPLRIMRRAMFRREDIERIATDGVS